MSEPRGQNEAFRRLVGLMAKLRGDPADYFFLGEDGEPANALRHPLPIRADELAPPQ